MFPKSWISSLRTYLDSHGQDTTDDNQIIAILQLPFMFLFTLMEIVISLMFEKVKNMRFYSNTQGVRHTQQAIVSVITSLFLIFGFQFGG